MSRDIKYIGMDVHKEAMDSITSFPLALRTAITIDLLQPQVKQVLVCNPRRNALLKMNCRMLLACVSTRLKAMYRGWGIACAGSQVVSFVAGCCGNSNSSTTKTNATLGHTYDHECVR